MNRCAVSSLEPRTRRAALVNAFVALAFAAPGAWVAGLLGVTVATSAQAQLPRVFPQTALRGEIVVTAPPEVLLNGQPARLAPGARIRGDNNMMQLSGTLVGQRLLVNYTVDPVGLVFDVWVLRPDEAAKRPWPRTSAEAQAWVFDAAAQTWSRP
jgi:hypothetical protein